MTGHHEPYPVGAFGQMIFCRTCEAFTAPGMRYWMRKVWDGTDYLVERHQEDRYDENRV